jgi:hypothetical protein
VKRRKTFGRGGAAVELAELDTLVAAGDALTLQVLPRCKSRES